MDYNAQSEWTKKLTSGRMSYPSEYIIRIFRGEYPKLVLKNFSYKNKKLLDIGCGDGRNMAFLKSLGFDVHGLEITEEIAEKITENLNSVEISATVVVGNNRKIPFPKEFFDFLVSWNSCYYMGHEKSFDNYVDEFARISKPESHLILSIPKKSCFIFKDSEEIRPGYREIKNDPFGVRNGEILRCFEDSDEIEATFSKHFEKFTFASIHDDCFGFNYHWHLAVCQKKDIYGH